jgi:hypothetical protein
VLNENVCLFHNHRQTFVGERYPSRDETRTFRGLFVYSFWLLLYAHRHRRILGTAGYNILTPANQLMVMGLRIWSLSNPGFEPVTFRRDHMTCKRLKQACDGSALWVAGVGGELWVIETTEASLHFTWN